MRVQKPHKKPLLESTPQRGVQAPPPGIRAGCLRRGCFKEPKFSAMQASCKPISVKLHC